MIIVRSPYRVSFFGGGSDYRSWYSEHGGAVLTSTLDKYCYLSVRRMPPFLDTKYRVFWSKMEAVNRIEDIQHAGVRGCLQAMEIDDGIEVNHAGDLPARSGLGSSSSFTVGMLHALHALKGEHVGKDQLAREAIHVEQDILGETVGIQDQIECAHGGLNLIEIARDGGYAISPIILPASLKEALESRLMLFFTGIQRHASEIAADQVVNSDRKRYELTEIAALVPKALQVLVNGDLDRFGHLLHETWVLKRSLSDKVSNSTIEDIYARARAAGALGGKVLGAGGGGFLLFYTTDKEKVRQAIPELLEVPFRFGREGSRVMVYEP